MVTHDFEHVLKGEGLLLPLGQFNKLISGLRQWERICEIVKFVFNSGYNKHGKGDRSIPPIYISFK